MNMQSAEQRAAILEAERLLTEEAKANWKDPSWREAKAAELTTQIQWGFQHENLLQYFSTVENADVGDRITIEEVYGLEVFWVNLGGQIDESTQTEDVYELKPDYVGFHVSMLDDDMKLNFGRRSRQMVNNAIEQIDAAISSRLVRTIQRAIPGPASTSFVQHAGFDLDKLDQAIDEVLDESFEPDGVAVVGRQTMMSGIMNAVRDSNLFAPATMEQIVVDGYLGRYRGVPLIRLRNVRDRNKAAYFPKNELIVCSKDASKVGLWGGLDTREGTEQFGWRWHYLGRRSAGFAVWRPEAMRRYVNTNITP